MSHNKLFVLFDGRAHTMDTDDCSVIDTAFSEQEARHISKENSESGYCVDALWCEYDTEGELLVNQRKRPDLSHNSRKRKRRR